MSKKQPQQEKPKPKKKMEFFKKNQSVYFTAFLKQNKNRFYICKGVIEECPQPNERQIFKVKIVAVGNRAIGGPEEFSQSALLGRSISKKFRELHKTIPFFMEPPGWIEVPSK